MRNHFTLQQALVLCGAAFVLDNIGGIAYALATNLRDYPNGPARDTWITSGTAITPPVVFLAPFALLVLLAAFRGRAGMIGTVCLTLINAVSVLATVGDLSGTGDAITLHHQVLVVPATVVVLGAATSVLILALGALRLVGAWGRGRGRRAQALSSAA